MAYPGGKAASGVFQRIINEIPPHEVYVEAFLGDGAVLRRKRPAARSIGIDIDGAVFTRWSGAEAPNLELYHCCALAWLKHHFGLYRLKLSSAAIHGGAANAPTDPFAAHRSRYLVYCDPPYPDGARRSKRPPYRYTFLADQHEELVRILVRLPCMVMVSGYAVEPYLSALSCWRKVSFAATTRANTPATEHLWMNFPEPEQLHDYRFVGANRRDRERIRRRAANLTSMLQGLPARERGAIIDSVLDELRTGPTRETAHVSFDA